MVQGLLRWKMLIVGSEEERLQKFLGPRKPLLPAIACALNTVPHCPTFFDPGGSDLTPGYPAACHPLPPADGIAFVQALGHPVSQSASKPKLE
ncbi:hypothetical protein NDU88_005461 [Pleurodeles waltl]|uniref:Uncharacterized protein n=1 Tax=Pleurodeles waltl TaxID=8319 RepID=A0AAV7SLT0_PLEWA|nr:hypothetical protein NDU88_005461 [Pleurodeles waltl]